MKHVTSKQLTKAAWGLLVIMFTSCGIFYSHLIWQIIDQYSIFQDNIHQADQYLISLSN